MGRLGLMSPLSGMRFRSTAQIRRKEGTPVQQFKELNACIADLKALLAGNDVRPEQRKDVEAAIEELRRLRRKRNASQPDFYGCVRRITERLIKAFFKN
jgi:hypothetical protein